MDDVINWCEERGIEIEHTDYGFKGEAPELAVFYRDSLLHIMICQSENNLQTQIRADPADVEVNGSSLSIRNDHETRVIVSPPFVMDTSNTEQ